MSILKSLREPSACHRVEETADGFFIVREDAGPAEEFNDLAREAMRRAGDDYIALPLTDGAAGYDRVFILPTR